MKFRSMIIALLAVASTTSMAKLVDGTVGYVNNEAILESDLIHLKNNSEKPGAVFDLLLGEFSANQLKSERKAQIEYLINEKILDSEVKRLSLTITQEAVESELSGIASQQGATKAEFLERIKAQGMIVSEYQAFLKTQMERNRLISQEVVSKIQVSDEEIMSAYLQIYPQRKVGTYEYSLAHVFFSPRKGGSDAAKLRAEAVSAKLKAGESFETLAEQNSEDPNFSAGGLLGTFKSGEFQKEMEDAVKDKMAGDFTEIVASRTGFHILKILTKKMSVDSHYEKEKDKIALSLKEKAYKRFFLSWLKQRKDDGVVVINHP